MVRLIENINFILVAICLAGSQVVLIVLLLTDGFYQWQTCNSHQSDEALLTRQVSWFLSCMSHPILVSLG